MRKIKRFVKESDTMVNEFLKTIQPMSIKPCGLTPGTNGELTVPILVTWEETDEAELLDEIEEQRSDIALLKPIAKKVADDEQYLPLKNNKQREVYLLEEYGVPKSQLDTLLAIVHLIGEGVPV